MANRIEVAAEKNMNGICLVPLKTGLKLYDPQKVTEHLLPPKLAQKQLCHVGRRTSMGLSKAIEELRRSVPLSLWWDSLARRAAAALNGSWPRRFTGSTFAHMTTGDLGLRVEGVEANIETSRKNLILGILWFSLHSLHPPSKKGEQKGGRGETRACLHPYEPAEVLEEKGRKGCGDKQS